MIAADKVFCVIYSTGGIGDVGRHAVRAALDQFEGKVRVITRFPESLEEVNWNSASGPHSFTDAERERLEIIALDVTKDDLVPHMTNVGTVVSALGIRQPFLGSNNIVGEAGTKNLVKAMESCNVDRVVAVTSVGCNEDWPPIEFHWTGHVLKFMFRTVSRSNYRDLNLVENALKKSKLDYLLVRPMGLGEERKTMGEYFIQKKKGEDKVGPDMAKMDCATFVVKEALNPSYHKTAVVIGSNWDTFELNPPKYDLKATV
jgi:nucleoside-diphosphate-sugar epimerase